LGGGQIDQRFGTAKTYYLGVDETVGSTATIPAIATGKIKLRKQWEWGPSSEHSDGAHHLMGDGSVRFAKSTINQLTWSSLHTRAGGEVVSDGDW
jgi:hypothetical protein